MAFQPASLPLHISRGETTFNQAIRYRLPDIGVKANLAITEAVGPQRSAFRSPQPRLCTCLLGGAPDGGLEQFVDEGLVRLALRTANRRISAKGRGSMRIAMSCFSRPVVGRLTRRGDPRKDTEATIKAALRLFEDGPMECGRE